MIAFPAVSINPLSISTITPNFDTWMPKFADFGLLAPMISIGWVHKWQKSCSYMNC